jgi:ABC-type dipeptide/oligopeptide/nickel transport system permease component
MTQYIIRRLLILPITLFGVTVLIFLMMSFLSPEMRAALYVTNIPRNPQEMAGVIKRYDLDKPIYVQYWNWLVGTPNPATGQPEGGILRGDFGYSRSMSQSVASVIQLRFPATIELTLYSIIPIILVGIWLGVLAAVNHNKPIDQVARVISIIGYSFPTFVLGLMLLMIFYARLHWFPAGRVSDWVTPILYSPGYNNYTGLVTIDAILNGRLDIFWDGIRHLVLPVLTLSTVNWAVFLRITRSSMLEAMGQEYVVTARAKGVIEANVINKHARPNALIPVITYAGIEVGALLGGVVFTETIFNFPGIGNAAALAAEGLDVVTVLALTLLTGAILIIANLVVDVLYASLDPRIRLA